MCELYIILVIVWVQNASEQEKTLASFYIFSIFRVL